MPLDVSDLITQLTAAVDQPNPSPPPTEIDGSAGEADEVAAEQLLAELVQANTRYQGALGLAASWQAKQDAAAAAFDAKTVANEVARVAVFAEWDRSVRALETMLIAADPVPPTLDDLFEPETPMSIGDITGSDFRWGEAMSVARDLLDAGRIEKEMLVGAQASRDRYFDAQNNYAPTMPAHTAHMLRGAASRAAGAEAGLQRVADRAQEYLDYLDAI
jgi:hypothetical protein